ncbi:MAG: ABC transporter substrate-binding protein, partial [Spirochaetes bacterium]
IVLLMVALATAMYATGVPEAESETVTIQIAYPVAIDAPVTEILDGYARAFESEHPNVTVETIYSGGYGDVKTTIQTTIDGGGDAPALAVMLATDLFDLANSQYIEPMTAMLDKMPGSDAYLADFLPAFLTNSYYQDDMWSLPFQRSAVMLYYNADLFSQAGLAVPDDWKSLGEAAAALTVRDGDTVSRWGIEWPSGWPYWLFQPLAMGGGQNIVGDSDTDVYFDNPGVIDAIRFYNSLSSEFKATPPGVQAVWGNAVPDFVSGNTAMIVHSSGSLSKVLVQAPFKVGVMGIPGKQKGSSFSVPGGGNLYLVAGSNDAEKQAAFDFAVFLTDPARAADFSINTGYIATRSSAFDDAAMKTYVSANPQAGEAKAILASAGKELSLQNLGQVRSIFHNYLQSAFNGEMTPEAAMQAAQKEADAALADFR